MGHEEKKGFKITAKQAELTKQQLDILKRQEVSQLDQNTESKMTQIKQTNETRQEKTGKH